MADRQHGHTPSSRKGTRFVRLEAPGQLLLAVGYEVAHVYVYLETTFGFLPGRNPRRIRRRGSAVDTLADERLFDFSSTHTPTLGRSRSSRCVLVPCTVCQVAGEEGPSKATLPPVPKRANGVTVMVVRDRSNGRPTFSIQSPCHVLASPGMHVVQAPFLYRLKWPYLGAWTNGWSRLHLRISSVATLTSHCAQPKWCGGKGRRQAG